MLNYPQAELLYFPEISSKLANLAYGERKVVLTQGMVAAVEQWRLTPPKPTDFHYPSRSDNKRQRMILSSEPDDALEPSEPGPVASLQLVDLNKEHRLAAALPSAITNDFADFFSLQISKKDFPGNIKVLTSALKDVRFLFVLDLFRKNKSEVEVVLTNAFHPN